MAESFRIYKNWGRDGPRGTLVRAPKRRKGVFVHHTVTTCKGTKMADEKAHMRYLQDIAFSRAFTDISYNHILFPKTGRVYRGRGFEFVGAHNDGDNTDWLGIAVVGNFEVDPFPQIALRSLINYVRRGEDQGYLPEHPFIFGHRDTDATACPGLNVYKNLDAVRKAVGGRK